MKKEAILDPDIIDYIKREEERKRQKRENDRPHAPPPPGGPEDIPEYDPEKRKEWEEIERKRRQVPGSDDGQGVTEIKIYTKE